MSVLIVGGDHLGSIPRELTKLGATRIVHMSGRDQSGFRNGLPETMDLIIVLCDYASHNLIHKVKDLAKSRGIPILFAKRSWASIYQKLGMLRLLG
jgi:hypothetical protein